MSSIYNLHPQGPEKKKKHSVNSHFRYLKLQVLNIHNWLVVEPTPLKNDGVKVSWDDCSIPNIWRVIIHSCSSHHQPDKDPFVGPEIPIPWHLHLGHQRQPSHLCGGPRGRGARARAAQGRPGGLGIHEVR